MDKTMSQFYLKIRCVQSAFLSSLMITAAIPLLGCSHSSKDSGDPNSASVQGTKLEGEANLKTPSTSQSQEMMKAIFTQDAAQVRQLVQKGIDLSYRDGMGYSYLHLAVGVGNIEVIEALIKAGLSVNLQAGAKRSTPSHSAVKMEQVNALKTLMAHGADLSIQDADGKTPKDLITDYSEFKKIFEESKPKN